MMKKILKFIPSRIISTIFGLGFFSTYRSILAAIIAYGLSFIILEDTVTFHEKNEILGTIIFYEFIFAFYIGIIFIAFYLKEFSSNRLFGKPVEESIIIDKLAGHFLVLSLVIPAIESHYIFMYKFFNNFCGEFILCDGKLVIFSSYFIAIATPPFLFIFLDYIKMWPANLVDVNMGDNAIGIVLDDIISAIYTVIIYYLMAIIIFDLPITIAKNYIINLNEYVPILGEIIHDELSQYPILEKFLK